MLHVKSHNFNLKQWWCFLFAFSIAEIFCLGTNRKLCHADKKCIDKAGWCNRYPDCSDGEDERECNGMYL